jgi:hypothetical protein
MRLAPGMTFAFEPNCVFDGKLASIGGTVIIGEDGADRARSAHRAAAARVTGAGMA